MEAVEEQLLALAPRIKFRFDTNTNGNLGECAGQPEVAGIRGCDSRVRITQEYIQRLQELRQTGRTARTLDFTLGLTLLHETAHAAVFALMGNKLCEDYFGVSGPNAFL